jgi:hypothetical protein
MVEIVPAIIAATASVAAVIVTKNDIEPLPQPDPEEASRKATESQVAIRKSRDSFIQRQGTLGPIQLQAPTLRI